MLATKFHNQMGPDQNQRGNSRRWIMKAVDDSLRRLRTDWIDLYQVHRPDPQTAIEETVAALSDLVRAGKIRYWGTSTFPAADLVEAQWAAEAVGGYRTALRATAVFDLLPRHRARRARRFASATAWACSRGARSRADG